MTTAEIGLTEWLLEQIAADERDLKENTDWDQWMIKPSLIAARIRRIQSECDAKRKTVEQYQSIEIDEDGDRTWQLMQRAEKSALGTVLQRWAAIYALEGRPGYREGWTP